MSNGLIYTVFLWQFVIIMSLCIIFNKKRFSASYFFYTLYLIAFHEDHFETSRTIHEQIERFHKCKGHLISVYFGLNIKNH